MLFANISYPIILYFTLSHYIRAKALRCEHSEQDDLLSGIQRPDTPSLPITSLGFRGFDSSRLLILKGGNSHVRIIVQGFSRKV